METMTTVGIDLAKTVFQVHAIDAGGAVIVSSRVNQALILLPCEAGEQPCL